MSCITRRNRAKSRAVTILAAMIYLQMLAACGVALATLGGFQP